MRKTKIKQPRKQKQPAWRTADGRRIPISELGDSHLVNILSMMEETLQLRKQPPSFDRSRSIGSTYYGRRGGKVAALQDSLVMDTNLPDGGRILEIQRHGDGRSIYKIEYETSPRPFLAASVAVATASTRRIPTELLIYYDAMVLEAVRRGLFSWNDQRKYLTAISDKIHEKYWDEVDA